MKQLMNNRGHFGLTKKESIILTLGVITLPVWIIPGLIYAGVRTGIEKIKEKKKNRRKDE